MLRWPYVPIEREGNPHWPLPADYPDLVTAEAQRQARVNACLMGEQDPDAAVQSWLWFCTRYLMPDAEEMFDPLFYKPPVRDYGFIHLMMVRALEAYPRSAMALARGSAKTTTILSYIVWKLCTHKMYTVNLYKCRDDFLTADFQQVRDQFETNPRLIEDFGNLVPRRNEAPWSHRLLCTSTRSWLKGYSVKGRMRGGRCDKAIPDDVEYDPDDVASATADKEVEQLTERITRVLVPMLDEGCGLGIFGTLVHARSFLAMATAKDGEIPDRDKRFRDELWYRVNIPAVIRTRNPDGTSSLRRSWSKFTDAFLEDKREAMGDAAYGSEYEGCPVSSQRRPLVIVPALHEYVLVEEDDAALQRPFESAAKLRYNEVVEADRLQPIETGWSEHVRGLWRFITLDYAYTTAASSDWSVIHVMGVDGRNNLWSLDMEKVRLSFTELVGLLWQHALRWRVAVVAIEAYPVQEEYYQQAEAFSEQFQEQYGHCPQCLPIRPPQGKGQRIARLQYRFVKGRLKLPGHRRTLSPYFYLYQQIRNFTEDMANLRNDDEIDTLSMSADVLRGRTYATPKNPAALTPLELLARGDVFYPDTQIPIVPSLPLQSIPVTILRKLQKEHYRGAVAALGSDPGLQQPEAGPVDPYLVEQT